MINYASNLKSLGVGYFNAWLKKRLPYTKEIQLNQKRIFIFPSATGWLFIALLLLLFVTSVNYQNNLLFSLTCLFVSLFVTSILATYQNLSGLIIRALPSENVYSGEFTALKVQLDSSKTNAKYALFSGFKGDQQCVVNSILDKHDLALNYRASTRGYLETPRISFYSFYPMGLLRCWTWVSLDFSAWVYPKIHKHEFIPSEYSGGIDSGEIAAYSKKISSAGTDDFEGLNAYRQGESLKRIAWRHYAKTNVLLSKEFSSEQKAGGFLDWYVLEGVDTERRLEILCGWVNEFEMTQRPYGLRLPTRVINVDIGASHKQECLLALAQFGLEGLSQAVGVRGDHNE